MPDFFVWSVPSLVEVIDGADECEAAEIFLERRMASEPPLGKRPACFVQATAKLDVPRTDAAVLSSGWTTASRLHDASDPVSYPGPPHYSTLCGTAKKLFAIGDVVSLKSGAHRMTIRNLKGKTARLVWSTGQVICKKRLPIELLKGASQHHLLWRTWSSAR